MRILTLTLLLLINIAAPALAQLFFLGGGANPSVVQSIALTGSNCSSSQCGFLASTAGTVGTASPTMSAGSFGAGTYQLACASGCSYIATQDHAATACPANATGYGTLSINSSGAISNTAATPGAIYSICVAATPAGGFTFVQQFTAYGGWFVAVGGNDSSGTGAITAPYATVNKCQTSMRGSATNKYCFWRGGTYGGSGVGYTTQTVSSQTYALYLTSSDNGETVSNYPPDGSATGSTPVNITGNASSNTTGVRIGAAIEGGSNITINGLVFHHFTWFGISVHGGAAYDTTQTNSLPFPVAVGTATGNTISNNIVHDNYGNVVDGGFNYNMYLIQATGDTPNTTITHNYVYNGVANGIADSMVFTTGSIAGSVVTYNFVQNVNTNDIQDAGCLGFANHQFAANAITVKYNYCRDYGTSAASPPFNGIYMDDGTSNITVEYNVVAGNGGGCFKIHNGNTNTIKFNICDISTNNNYWNIFQGDNSSINVSGSVYQGNLLIAGVAGQGWGYAASPSTNALVTGNYYAFYSGGAYSTATAINTGSNDGFYGNGGTTGGIPGDQSPIIENPGLTCWSYTLPSNSNIFVPPSNWGTAGFWGPPGFTVTQTGTVPSSPHSC